MAKTQYIDVPDELKTLQGKALEQRDRFILGVVQGHKREPSKVQKKLLKRAAIINSPQQGRGSLFKYLSPYWRALTPEQKATWKTAGAYSTLTNWQLFVSDNAARIRNSLTFPTPPSEEWQVRTGYVNLQATPVPTGDAYRLLETSDRRLLETGDYLLLESEGGEVPAIKLKQEHPLTYQVTQKVAGKPWKQELATLTEVFSLPLQIGISYKSNLTPTGSEQRARFYADIWTSYQGEDINNLLEINFSPSADWTTESVTTDNLRGILIGYTLYLDIYGYTGTLLFDNVRAVHGGTNWARDPRCDDVTKVFTKGFAGVPPFWIQETLTENSSFSTEFPPAL
jgi:hypothetical protein